MATGESEKRNTPGSLVQTGLPQFDLAEDGYPDPGKVVKYYRERMTYTDKDGKEKRWTQAELAKRLGITDIMVNIMENQNKGLDSIERRRALATILRIPPVLLGLDSLDHIVEIVTGQEGLKQSTAKRAKISKDTVKLYQSTFSVYIKLYAEGLTYAIVSDIDKWTKRIEQNTEHINIEDKNALLRVLWDYEILCAKIYGSDLQNWSKAFEHTDNAIEIATALGDRDLQAASLYYSSIYHFRQGRLGLARVDIDGALVYAKGALQQTKGRIYSQNACVYADDTSLSGITLAQNIFDEAEKYVDVKSGIGNNSFGKDDYLFDRAYTLINVGRPAKALELLEDVERYVHPSGKRLFVFLDILRAKCYVNLKKPEYEQAVVLLEGAIEDSKEIRVARNIDQIERLYRKLVESSYGKSPDVVDLGLLLQDLRLKNS